MKMRIWWVVKFDESDIYQYEGLAGPFVSFLEAIEAKMEGFSRVEDARVVEQCVEVI